MHETFQTVCEVLFGTVGWLIPNFSQEDEKEDTKYVKIELPQ
jgi:hypothetical protein